MPPPITPFSRIATLSRNVYWALAALLLFAHLVAGLCGHDFEVSADGLEYVRMAENMLAGQGFTFDGVNPVVGRTPGTSVLISAHLAIVGNLSGFHVIQLILLFTGYLAVSLMARRVFGNSLAITVLTGMTLLQPVRGLAANALSEPLFIALFASGLGVLHKSLLNRDWRVGALAGMLFGISTYVRPVSVFWPLFLVSIVFLFRRDRLAIAAVVLGMHSIVIAPWIVRGHNVTGKFIPMTANWGPLLTMTDDQLWRLFSTSSNRYIFQSPQFDRASRLGFLYNPAPQEVLRSAALDGWRRDLVKCFWRCARQSLSVWTYLPGTREWKREMPIAFWIGRAAMLVFYAVSLVGLSVLWRADRTVAVLLVGQSVYTAAIVFPISTEARYLVPSYLCLLPATACGISLLFSRFRMITSDNRLDIKGHRL